MRIVSLLPSATEIICGLGLRGQLVGVTHECDFPADVAGLPKVTQTLIPTDATSLEIDVLVREQVAGEQALYSLDMSVLETLSPDLIVTQALCDVCAVAQSEVNAAACSLPGNPQVINLEPNCFSDVLQCIRQVALAAQCEALGETYVEQLQRRIDHVAQQSNTIKHHPDVLLLEWIDPLFCAGHWNPELVHLAGGHSVFGKPGERSVTTSWSEILTADPEVMVVACCGFGVERTMQDLPILQNKPGWQSLRCVKDGRVHVVDGSAYFNRPGPRLVDSLEILANAIHRNVHRLPSNLSPATKID